MRVVSITFFSKNRLHFISTIFKLLFMHGLTRKKSFLCWYCHYYIVSSNVAVDDDNDDVGDGDGDDGDENNGDVVAAFIDNF